MKIKAKKGNLKSMNLIVPIDGVIAIDEKGCADVSPKCAAILVSNTSDWEFVKGAANAAKPEKESNAEDADVKQAEESEIDESEINEEEDEINGEEINEDEDESEKLTEESLNAMTVAQLKETCKEAGLPEAEYKNLSKKLLVAYILKNAAE